MTNRVQIKVEQIARMRVAGIKDGKIAELLGITQGGLARILALQEYKDIESAILMGQVSKLDEALAGRVQAQIAYFKVGVPASLRAMLETVVQQRDLKARLEAAKEILDRDPDRTFAKKQAVREEPLQTPAIPAGVLNSVAAEADAVASALRSNQDPSKAN